MLNKYEVPASPALGAMEVIVTSPVLPTATMLIAASPTCVSVRKETITLPPTWTARTSRAKGEVAGISTCRNPVITALSMPLMFVVPPTKRQPLVGSATVMVASPLGSGVTVLSVQLEKVISGRDPHGWLLV